MGCLKEGMDVDYLIIGGDERFAHLARMLRKRGQTVGTLLRDPVPGVAACNPEALGNAGSIVVNCPPRIRGGALTIKQIQERIPDSARMYLCGPGHPCETTPRMADLWADEALLEENARLTAEGAVCAAMRAGSCALRGMRCMVIGWGRVGRALTELLVAMGAHVTVASRTAAHRRRAIERGAEAASTGSIALSMPSHRLILNTAPERVLDAAALERADDDAMIIDLASPPYGVDLRAAWSRGLRAWREPGLPGRHCPESAAKALLAAMDRAGKEEKAHA